MHYDSFNDIKRKCRIAFGLNATTMGKSSSFEEDKSDSFLQQVFGVDTCCTIYEEDEGFKLLADLSLCMYFGCGNSSENEVPKVVSVANSEDYTDRDSVSDICEERHRSNKNAKDSPEPHRKPDPPPTASGPVVISLVHPPPPPPPPPQISSPSTEQDKNVEESSRISLHYESREALEEGDEENIPPEEVLGRRRKSKVRTDRDVPPVIYGKKTSKSKNDRGHDEYPVDEYPADESPTIVYSDEKPSWRGRRAYV